MKRLILAIVLICIPITANAWWKSIQQVAVGSPPPSYVGPGDVVGSWFVWGSCSRVYDLAHATTSTSMCDLVAVTGGAAVCTLRGSASGFVDLTAYCPGSVTPMAACAAASGGSCKVTKVYDQTGNGNDFTQATLATMPALTFSSSPTGTLPVMTGPSASTLLATASLSQATPLTLSAVYRRTAAFTAPGIILGGNSAYIAAATIAGNAQVYGGTAEIDAVASDSAWHSLQGMVSNSAGQCAINVDGSDTAGQTCGTTGIAFQAMRVFRSPGGTQMQGDIVEIGMLGASTTPTQRNSISSNQHGSSGYSF